MALAIRPAQKRKIRAVSSAVSAPAPTAVAAANAVALSVSHRTHAPPGALAAASRISPADQPARHQRRLHARACPRTSSQHPLLLVAIALRLDYDPPPPFRRPTSATHCSPPPAHRRILLPPSPPTPLPSPRLPPQRPRCKPLPLAHLR